MAEVKLCECGCGEPTRIAEKTDRGNGREKGRALRFIVGHNLRLAPKLKPMPPAWHEADRGYGTPCWIWDGPMMSTGYGEIRNPVRQLAHRWSYETHVGPIPEGLQIDHLCRVSACVNPAHLEPVTNRENVRRGLRTKLTDADVELVRKAPTTRAAVLRFGISEGYAAQIRRGAVRKAA